MVEPTVQLLAAVLMVLVAVGFAGWADTLPLSDRTVIAVAPWTVAGAGVIVAVEAGIYDRWSLASTPTLAAVVVASAVGCWLVLSVFAELREKPHRERYLTASGTGAAVVIVGSLLFIADEVTALRLTWVLLAVIVAPVVGVCGYFALSLVYTDAVARLRFAGLYAVTTVVFDGVASAIAVEVLGTGHRAIVASLLSLATQTAGISPSGWLLLGAHVVVGVLAVGVFGELTRRNPTVGYSCTLLVSVCTLGSGTVVLLSSTLF